MDGFLTLAYVIVEWIDERFGRAAAWTAAACSIVALLGAALALAIYLIR